MLHTDKSTNLQPEKPQFTKAHACGKAIIVGEHAVVYGARAIAMPLRSMKISIEMKPGPLTDGKPLIRGVLGDKVVSDRLIGVIHDAFHTLSISPFSCDLKVTSSLPIGGGLGSSAAVCVALLRTFSKSIDHSVSTSDLSTMANTLETRFHGKPSGLDTTVVAREEVISFAKGQATKTVAVKGVTDNTRSNIPWRFALIDSGLRASTSTMVKLAAPYFDGGRNSVRIAEFSNLADKTIAGLELGDEVQVANAMNQANSLIIKAGVTNNTLDSITKTARDIGVLAAKPTGAGGGGFVLCLLDHGDGDDQVDSLKQKFGDNSVTEVTLP